jgi:hypothetical protein
MARDEGVCLSSLNRDYLAKRAGKAGWCAEQVITGEMKAEELSRGRDEAALRMSQSEMKPSSEAAARMVWLRSQRWRRKPFSESVNSETTLPLFRSEMLMLLPPEQNKRFSFKWTQSKGTASLSGLVQAGQL